MKAPAARACGSCPYRCDAPSGLWAQVEYAKLPEFDKETHEQPPRAFSCHQQDGRLCAGWVGCHDMDQSLGLRLAATFGHISEEDLEATLAYQSPVPLFASGAAAAEHGMRDALAPGPRASRTARKLLRRRGVQVG